MTQTAKLLKPLPGLDNSPIKMSRNVVPFRLSQYLSAIPPKEKQFEPVLRKKHKLKIFRKQS